MAVLVPFSEKDAGEMCQELPRDHPASYWLQGTEFPTKQQRSCGVNRDRDLTLLHYSAEAQASLWGGMLGASAFWMVPGNVWSQEARVLEAALPGTGCVDRGKSLPFCGSPWV